MRAIATIDTERTVVDKSAYFDYYKEQTPFNGVQCLDLLEQYKEYVCNAPKLKEFTDVEIEIVSYQVYTPTIMPVENTETINRITKIRHFSQDPLENLNPILKNKV